MKTIDQQLAEFEEWARTSGIAEAQWGWSAWQEQERRLSEAVVAVNQEPAVLRVQKPPLQAALQCLKIAEALETCNVSPESLVERIQELSPDKAVFEVTFVTNLRRYARGEGTGGLKLLGKVGSDD